MNEGDFIPADGKHLAAQIALKRGRRTKVQFAEYLGTSRVNVDRWEKGISMPGAGFLEALGLSSWFRIENTDPIPMSATPLELGGQTTRGPRPNKAVVNKVATKKAKS